MLLFVTRFMQQSEYSLNRNNRYKNYARQTISFFDTPQMRSLFQAPAEIFTNDQSTPAPNLFHNNEDLALNQEILTHTDL